MSARGSDQSHETWRTKHKKNAHNYTTVALWRTLCSRIFFHGFDFDFGTCAKFHPKGAGFQVWLGHKNLNWNSWVLTFQIFLLKTTQKTHKKTWPEPSQVRQKREAKEWPRDAQPQGPKMRER